MLDSLLRAVYVGFVVNKLPTKEVCIRVLRFSPLSIIPPRLHIHAFHQPADGQWIHQRLHFHRDFVSPHHNSITTKCYVNQLYVNSTAHRESWNSRINKQQAVIEQNVFNNSFIYLQDQLNMFRANFCPSSGAQDWGFFYLQHMV